VGQWGGVGRAALGGEGGGSGGGPARWGAMPAWQAACARAQRLCRAPRSALLCAAQRHAHALPPSLLDRHTHLWMRSSSSRAA
jgi:hypothetical protein